MQKDRGGVLAAARVYASLGPYGGIPNPLKARLTSEKDASSSGAPQLSEHSPDFSILCTLWTICICVIAYCAQKRTPIRDTSWQAAALWR